MPKTFTSFVDAINAQRTARNIRDRSTGKVFRGTTISQSIGRVSTDKDGISLDNKTAAPILLNNSVRKV